MDTPDSAGQEPIVSELLKLARAEVARAYHTQLLADVLNQVILPTVTHFNAIVQSFSDPESPVSEESVRVILPNPGINEMLASLPDALADIQDNWATVQLLNAWQPKEQGPTSSARLRRNRATDAWQEETVERSISKATRRIADTRSRLTGYIAALQAQSKHYQVLSTGTMASISPELQKELSEISKAASGLANTIKNYAKVWGVEVSS